LGHARSILLQASLVDSRHRAASSLTTKLTSRYYPPPRPAPYRTPSSSLDHQSRTSNEPFARKNKEKRRGKEKEKREREREEGKRKRRGKEKEKREREREEGKIKRRGKEKEKKGTGI